MNDTLRHDWTLTEVLEIHRRPLLALVRDAEEVHRRWHAPDAVQLCTLLSVKTGGCGEDCGYCSQSAHHPESPVAREPLLDAAAVVARARAAREAGATRFCMGAAWREVKDGPAFQEVLAMVRGVKALGLETCCTLGMLTADQARALKAAGLDAYNHNLDTSRDFYGHVVTTRTYDDRLATLRAVREAGITVCCGGIIGMGETLADRAALLQTLATLTPHPESVPINALVAVPGTPMAGLPPVDPLDVVRTIATARILMPASRVRLSAGRTSLSREAQLLCFLAGANSVFYGEKLLTTPNPQAEADDRLFAELGLRPLPPAAEAA